MTEDEREKFERMEAESGLVPELRLASEAQRRNFETCRLEFGDIRDSLRIFARSTSELVAVSSVHERRLNALEGRAQ
jgi:hypothetical protein